MAATAAAERNLRAKLIFMLLGGIVRNSGVRTREAANQWQDAFSLKSAGAGPRKPLSCPRRTGVPLRTTIPNRCPAHTCPGRRVLVIVEPARRGEWVGARTGPYAAAHASAAASTAGFLFIPSGVCNYGGCGFCVFFFHLRQGFFQDVERHRGLLL